MNKTVTANISGIVFHIEIDAYEKLNDYLSTIKGYFSDSEGREEIMADIEARIAELFKDMLEGGRQVILMKDVEQVIEIMGQPEDYIDEDEKQENREKRAQGEEQTQKRRRVYRDPDNAILGGVCGGLGAYFGLDPLVFRIGFVLLTLLGGAAIIPYIILWAIIPEAKTTAEKLEMKGEEVNIDNISKTIEKEAERINKRFKAWNREKDGSSGLGKALENFIYFFVNLFVFLFRTLGKIIGFIFLIAGLGLAALFLIELIAGPEFFLFDNGTLNSVSLQQAGELLFLDNTMQTIACWGLLMITGIPVLALIYSGLSILFKIKSPRGVGITFASIWFVGIIMTSYAGVSLVREMQARGNNIERIEMQAKPGNIFTIEKMNETGKQKGLRPRHNSLRVKLDDYSLEGLNNDSLYLSPTYFDIVKSTGKKMELYIEKSSCGRTKREAEIRSEHINSIYLIGDSTITISPVYSSPLSEGFRFQKVKFTLHLPVGYGVYLSPSLKEMIFDIENVTDTWDPEMTGKTWVMTKMGLQCLDCENIKGISTEEFQQLVKVKDSIQLAP